MTPTQAFVTELYIIALNRMPDQAGFSWWVNAIDSGQTTADVAAATFANQAHIDRLVHDDATLSDDFYLSAFGRHEDAGGNSYWPTHGGPAALLKNLATPAAIPEATVHNAQALAKIQAFLDGKIPFPTGPVDNSPIIIHDTVPGPIVVKLVDTPDVHVESFGKLPTFMTNGAGNNFFGDGTTLSTGNVEVTSGDNGDGKTVTVALAIAPRQAADASKYAATNVVVDGNGATATTHVAGGTQSTATDSFANNATRDPWNFIINIGVTGETMAQHLAAGHVETLKIDGLTFNGAVNGAGVLQFGSITDFQGNSNVSSNSEQIRFFEAPPADGSTHDITLTDTLNGVVVASAHQVVIVGTTGSLAGTDLHA